MTINFISSSLSTNLHYYVIIEYYDAYCRQPLNDRCIHNNYISCQVTDVDKDVLLFVNLEELTLTGNLLSHISPSHLPAKLKVG